MSIRGKTLFFIIAIGVSALDLWSKHWAFSYVGDRGAPTDVLGGEKGIEIIPGIFYLTRVYNTGGIWGIGQDGLLSKGLIALRLIAVPAIIIFALRTPARDRRLLAALGLFAAGAVGNLYDNLFSENHGVRDFLDFYLIGRGGYHWPTFNIADAGIVCGVGLLLIDIVFGKRSAGAAAATTS